MDAQTDPTARTFFVRRLYPGDIVSCGGPYPTRDEANEAARRLRPANSRSVEVREERLDPIPRSGRHLVIRLRRKDGRPEHSVLVGPFVSRREARNFLRDAAEASAGSGPCGESPLGTLARDWEPIEANRTADLDEGSWLPDKRLAF